MASIHEYRWELPRCELLQYETYLLILSFSTPIPVEILTPDY